LCIRCNISSNLRMMMLPTSQIHHLYDIKPDF
jgi:hypothetical protein